MHSIERYGIVALLFLVVTVVAVLMWDGGKKKNEQVAGTNPAPVVDAPAPQAIDPKSRLSLISASQPGPLVRHLEGNNGAPTPAGAEPAPSAGGAALREAGAEAPVSQPATPGMGGEFLRPDERPAPAERPIARESAPTQRPYVVKSGDTLSQIAQRELGSSRRWQEITALNPGLDPARLRSGKTIQLPGGERLASAGDAPKSAPAPRAETPKKEPVTASARTHKVGQGENLWKIAARTLGDGKRWKEIAALNPNVNPDRLVLGQVLKLPASAKAAGSTAGTTRVAE
ncbi:MAG: LysM peptidoglycan-binding domain-containing protein, partial [Planctomycetota bacterium]